MDVTATAKRPAPVTALGWLFVALGAVGSVAAIWGAWADRSIGGDSLVVLVSRLLAFLGGAFALRGNNWARWLLIAWMGVHVAIGGLHDLLQLVVHGALFAVVAYLLFRPRASEWFTRRPAR